MSATDIQKKFVEFEKAVEAGKDLSRCSLMLTELKIDLTKLPGLQPGATVTQINIGDIKVARDIYEVGALLSVKQQDERQFERHVAQAKTYYVDYGDVLGHSKHQNLLLGLNLMRLMAQNRIAEFHTELELVPRAARSDELISFALKLENCLMEGSYSEMRDASSAVPHPLFAYFVGKLMDTVCEEIAACCERAYRQLPVPAARRMLALKSDDDVLDLAEVKQWRVEENVIVFREMDEGVMKMDQVPSGELIKRSLAYARELEQII